MQTNQKEFSLLRVNFVFVFINFKQEVTCSIPIQVGRDIHGQVTLTLLQYRVVQLNFTPEIEVFYMMFETSLSIFSMTSLKQHTEYVLYLHFRCKIQLDPLCTLTLSHHRVRKCFRKLAGKDPEM